VGKKRACILSLDAAHKGFYSKCSFYRNAIFFK